MKEVFAVKLIGEQIGYGHLMEIASALWRRKLKETNLPESGAFVPTIIHFIKNKELKYSEKSSKIYDEIVELEFKKLENEYNLKDRKPYKPLIESKKDSLKNLKEYWSDGIIREPKGKQ